MSAPVSFYLPRLQSSNHVFLDLQEWCRKYLRETPWRATAMERFAISFYQIHQGMRWNRGPNRDESYCAAYLHLLMVAEDMDLRIESYDVKDMAMGSWCEHMLLCYSRMQQQVWYWTQHQRSCKPQRASRYSGEGMRYDLHWALELLMYVVDNREQGIEDAKRIMTGDLR